jgi:hypothetical protein
MGETRKGAGSQPTYVVLREIAADTWKVVAEVARRPGVPARRGRAKAVEDALGQPPAEGERFAVIPRSEWRVGLDW